MKQNPAAAVNVTLRLVFVAAVLFASSGLVRVRAQKSGTAPANVAAGAPAGSYSLSGFESINLYSGNLNFNLPMVEVGGRGGIRVPFNLSVSNADMWDLSRPNTVLYTSSQASFSYQYDVFMFPGTVPPPSTMSSLFWSARDEWNGWSAHFEGGIQTPPNEPQPADRPYHIDAAFLHPNDMPFVLQYPKIGYNPGLLLYRTSYTGGQESEGVNPPPNVLGWSLTRLSFTTSDGTQYELRDVKTGGMAHDARTDGGQVYSRGRVFVAANDSSVTFVSDIDVTEQFQFNLDNVRADRPSGFLLFPDGTRYRIDSGNVSWIRDRNGNLTRFSYDSRGRVISTTDSEGRVVTVAYKGTTDPATQAVYDHDEIGFHGAGGQQRSIKVWRGHLADALTDGTTKNLHDLFPAWELDDGDEVVNPDDVVSAVELPDGRSYGLKYNAYGELASIILPTGGKIEYDYLSIGSPTYVQRRVAERRVFQNSSDASPELRQVFTYDINDGLPVHKDIQTVKMEQRAGSDGKLLSFEEHYFHGDMTVFHMGLYSSWQEGKEFKTETYDIDPTGDHPTTLLRTVEYVWKPRLYAYYYPSTNRDGGPAFDPRIVETITTLENGLVSRQTAVDPHSPDPQNPVVGFDRFNNPTDSWEYDFHMPGEPETLLRHTQTTYVTDAAYTGGSWDIGSNPDAVSILATPHLRGMPSRKSAYDANNIEQARTTFEYDNYIPDPAKGNRHAALISYGDIFGLCLMLDATGNCVTASNTSYTIRGNTTGTTSCLLGNDGSVVDSVTANQQYDVAGNVVKSVDARGLPTSFDFSDNFGSPDGDARTNVSPPELGSLKSYALPKSATNALGQAAYTQYDYYTSKVVNYEDANGQVAAYEYKDALDRLTKTIPPSGGGQVINEYGDTTGNLSVKVRRQIDGSVWDEDVTYFDGLGRTVKSQSHDAQGDVFSENVYDALGRICKTITPHRSDEEVHWIETSYDPLGRVKEVSSPKVANESTPAKLKSEYSAAATSNGTGLVTVGINQADKMSRSITNALGEIIRFDESNDSNDLGPIDNPTQATYYTYDTVGNPRKVVQGQQQRYFLYDSLGRLIRVRQPEQDTNPDLAMIDPVTGNSDWSTGFTYDSNGNVLTTTDAKGVTTSFEYDELGRVVRRSYSVPQTIDPKKITSSTSTVTFKYDGLLSPTPNNPNPNVIPSAKGELTEISNGTSTTQFTSFDGLGRILSSQQITDGQVYPFTYSYNMPGGLVEETYPSGRVVTNTLDAFGNLSQVSGHQLNQTPKIYASNIRRTADGAVDQFKLGNGRWETYQFNSRHQITQIGLGTSATDTGIWKVNYDYGRLNQDGTVDVTKNDGNVIRQTITVPGVVSPFVQSYTYDSLNRLTEAQETNGGQQTWKQTYGYDRYGNRTGFSYFIGQDQVTLNAVNQPDVDPLTNRFRSGQGYEYDFDGNLIQDAEGRKFTFDGDNKQSEVKNVNNNLIATYGYDGNGRRIKKTVVATQEVTVFVYDAGGRLIAEYSNAPVQNRGTHYITADILESPRVITDDAGSVISRKDFMPFGEDLFTDRSADQQYGYDSGIRQGFTGYQKDDETQQNFAEARYYNPTHGRFTTVDPLLASGKSLNPQSYNRYVYAGNNPTLRIDPNGQDWYVSSRAKLFNTTSGEKVVYQWNGGGDLVRSHVVWANSGDFRGWVALNPWENQAMAFATRDQALAQIEVYRRQALTDFLVGAAEANSLIVEWSGVLHGLGANKNSDMYMLGQKITFIYTEVQSASGVSLAGAILGKVAKEVPGLSRAASAYAKDIKILQRACFVAGTLVHTNKGLKAIEKIKAGDKVLSWDEHAKRFEYKTVAQAFVKQASRLVRVYVAGEGGPVVATPEHPFYARALRARGGQSGDGEGAEGDGQWVAAGELRAGDRVLRPGGHWVEVIKVEGENRDVAVYNFEVEDNHDYFVGTHGVLVHNGDCALASIAEKVTATFSKVGVCESCAATLARAFQKAGYSGEVIEARSVVPGSYIISDLYKGGREAIGDNGMHQGVLIGDTVYDAIAPQGIKLSDWLKSLDAAGGMQAGYKVIRSF
jgi:RHS repeat-associated protein